MENTFDILIKQARLRDGAISDIGIRDGRIAAIRPQLDGIAGTTIDARGNLVTESYVNPHLHLCKVYTLQMMDEAAMREYHGADMGKAMTAIELAARVKENYDADVVLENAKKALALAALYGNTHIRAFADVDSKAGLMGVEALIEAREAFRGIVEVQVVAFAQDGIIREPGAGDLLRKAMALGADVVGGIPWIELTDEDIARHVQIIFDIAEEFDRPVSMLVDDAGDPGLRSLELMAVETIRRNREGRSLAHHARAMALYPKPYLQKVMALLKRAQMGIVTNPHTGPMHVPVQELLQEDVLVCLGQDDISDAYYPYGRNNLLEVAFLASHQLWMTTAAEMDQLYDMITTRAAQAMGIEDFALAEGSPANLVVLDQSTILDALRYHAAPRHVISHGQLVDQTRMKTVAGV